MRQWLKIVRAMRTSETQAVQNSSCYPVALEMTVVIIVILHIQFRSFCHRPRSQTLPFLQNRTPFLCAQGCATPPSLSKQETTQSSLLGYPLELALLRTWWSYLIASIGPELMPAL